MIDRTGCAARNHGTYSAYRKDRCRCADAEVAYTKAVKRHRERYKNGEPSMLSQFVSAVGSRRRVQALVADGNTFEQIAAASGVEKGAIYKIANGVKEKLAPKTAEKIADGFAALSTVPGTCQRSIKLAREQNWYRAGMWDDIDDENEVVDCPVDPDDVDEVLVELFIKGEKTLYQLNAAEKNDAEQQMLAKGWDPEHVANRLHRTWTRETEPRVAA